MVVKQTTVVQLFGVIMTSNEKQEFSLSLTSQQDRRKMWVWGEQDFEEWVNIAHPNDSSFLLQPCKTRLAYLA